jgi:hypothetical protein
MDDVKTLDHYVRKALEFLEKSGSYTLRLPESRMTLVTGSQNGYQTGRILYGFGRGRLFVHEPEALAFDRIESNSGSIDDVTIVTATGSRDVVAIAGDALRNGLRVNAVVCRHDSPLERQFGKRLNIIHVPSIEEPPTVNVATYGRMIQGITHEDPKKISHLLDSFDKCSGKIIGFDQFTILLPGTMPEIAAMADWKSGELFGRQRHVRVFYAAGYMHGAGVTEGEKECYISLGFQNNDFGRPENRIDIPVPEGFGPLGYMMSSYYILGMIQKAKGDTLFQSNIADYYGRMKGWYPDGRSSRSLI